FYPRAWNLNGANSGFVMQPQSRYLLDMSYFRIKNITLGYNVPPRALSGINIDQARIYVSFENMFTFDKLRGLPIDPEAISGYSSLAGNSNLGRTWTSYPTFKIASARLNITRYIFYGMCYIYSFLAPWMVMMIVGCEGFL